MKNFRPIILVEDDEVDVMTVVRAFKDLAISNKIIIKENGEAAHEYLTDQANVKPCFILLDLNMPKMNGIEFLQIMKADEELNKIPIAILTTSNTRQDIEKCFSKGAAGYFVKSENYDNSVKSIDKISTYWSLSKLP